MILPNQHLDLSASLLGVGAHVLKCVKTPSTVTAVWEEFKLANRGVPFSRFILALDFLYTIGAVSYSDGLLLRSKKRSRPSDAHRTAEFIPSRK